MSEKFHYGTNELPPKKKKYDVMYVCVCAYSLVAQISDITQICLLNIYIVESCP